MGKNKGESWRLRKDRRKEKALVKEGIQDQLDLDVEEFLALSAMINMLAHSMDRKDDMVMQYASNRYFLALKEEMPWRRIGLDDIEKMNGKLMEHAVAIRKRWREEQLSKYKNEAPAEVLGVLVP